MDRRAVLRGLVAVGGVSALAACLDLADDSDVPTGDPEVRPDRQHAWNDSLETDEHGNVLLPEHHVFLSIEYDGDDRETDRKVLSEALRDVERAYEASNRGLLFTVGYSSSYFERFDEESPIPPAGRIVSGENVAIDDADLFIHLASDHAHVPLAVRETLFGDESELNGVDVPTLSGLFSLRSRRTGFIGRGLPAENDGNLQGLPEDAVDDEAPTFMNFRAGFRRNQATEDDITIETGRFAGGTAQHVEGIRFNLTEWFDRDLNGQVARLFSPALDGETVGPHGDRLTDHNGVDARSVEELKTIANEHGVVGHAQKLARFRDDGRPPLLRRDVNSADNGEAGMMFVSLQRDIETFVEMRRAMVGTEFVDETPVSERRENGIRQYIRPQRRSNVLITPREMRALP